MGHQIKVEDYGTLESPATASRDVTPVDGGEHVLFIYTMTADDADYVGAEVKIKVLTGENEADLGDRIYDSTLTLTQPVLAIGGILDDPEDMHRVPLNRAGVLPLKIFTRTTIDDISGPNEINILLPEGSGQPK
ncbi:hypothetical protein DSM43276_02677 [Mycobacteroides salmoniphilum]|uniref:hypothetical protein n=2 Tax=Mycobacteroides salmoniphilum TaxID=404941 RepID=UPI000994661D|nr:hypothetical protein [Mycobacteroides salmoniphilum]QCH24414.1 hypothetical protein DSM43276_02677 [Mycobacteroides salmoniphilum]